MLKIKNISARNFMSIGAQTQAVNFENSQLTLVLGQNLDLGGDGSRNGTGKTTIINALSYAMYGEALTSIKKDNLINKTNGKQMLVSVDFEIGQNKYRIERGRKPNVLRLFLNDKEMEDDNAQGDSRETQKEIEKIIGFPHNMFKHIVALNTYTEPFLSMRAADQREMIEQLLGITDLSAKADVLKELVRQTKEEIRDEETRINTVKESNKRIEKNIKDIELKSRAWDKSHATKLEELAQSILLMREIDVDREIELHTQHQMYNETVAAIAQISKDYNSLTASLSRAQKRLEGLESDLKSAEEGTCPSCGQGTAHLETHEEYTRDLKEKIAEETTHIDDINKQIDALVQPAEVEKPEDTFYNDVAQAYEHKHNLEALEKTLEEKREEKNPYLDQIETLRDTGLQEIDFEHINELSKLKDHQEFLHKLLTSKDSFIRKRIIDQNIAYLNHRLSYYLEKIGLPHEVKFASDLGVEITEFGRDLDFDNLSRGERNRLILSMSWAFRDIYESLNQPMNLMCIDELVDSGMDTTGVESALAILKKMNREQRKNILLVSHKEELVGRVNNVLTVIKTGGFTEYNTDTEYVN